MNGNVEQVLKDSIKKIDARREQNAQPIMPNMVHSHLHKDIEM
jgi:hypothetical protein